MSNKEFNVVKTLKLGEVTYRQWYVTLLDALEALDLDDFVKDFKYIRNDGDAAITKEEKGRIAKVKNIIRLSISNEDLESIMECNNPKEMISELDRKYRGPGAKSAWELLRDFDTIKFEGSIQGLFAKLRQLFAAFADKNIKLPSYFMNSKVRALLPAEYDEMCKMVDIYNGGRSETDYMSDKQFESELLRFEREKNLKFSAQNTSLAATIKSNNSSTLLNKKKFNGTCHYCKIKGHIEKFCRKKMNDSKSGQQNNEAKPSNENKLASLSAVVKISDIDCHMNQLSSNVSSSLSLVSVSSVKFLADCGASNHIVNDRSLLSNIRKTSHQIITMSGVVNGPEQGDMKCQLFNGKSWVPMVIRDVYYVAGQPFNLIAIGKICRRENVRSVTNNDGITIYHKEVPILIGEWSTEYLNIIELRIRIDVSSSKNIVNVAVNSMAKWHERFGHFSTNTIGKMFKQKLVDGIPNSLNNDIDYCTPCKIGKLTDISHHIESDNPHILPGSKLHLDIGGYTDVSIHGNRYFLLAVDHRSRFVKVAFMKSRDQTLDKFKCIVNEIKLETGNNVLCIRTDMGTEFRSELFQNYLSGHGIIHEKASVNTPQQNGRCERAMRTLMDHAISMLLSTDLPRFLWDEAVNCSAYLMNLVLNSRNEIPYEKYFGIKPDVSNLRIFGSEGQALNKNRNNKFDAKSKFVRMIGYEGQTIYRVYVSGARRVELCSSVDFDEKPKCVVQPIGFDVNKSTINNCESESNTVISFVDSRDDDVPNQPDSNFRGPGRPIGAKNRLFQQSEERLQSLRVLPGRSIVGVCVARYEPSTFNEAINSDESEKWREAMDKEYNQLIKHQTWQLVDKPDNEPIITVKWIFTIKDDGRYKARLVARGFEQYSDSLDIYAPVAQMDVIRLFFSLVASWDMDLIQFDCSNAFLNGDIYETVYIDQPLGYDDKTGRVCLLKKGLYGLRQSPRSWNRKFDEAIISLGFRSSTFDPCLYFIKKDNEFTMLCLYVDDALLASNIPGKVKSLFEEIGQIFEIRSVDSCKYLGINYTRNHLSKTIMLYQYDYLIGKLKMFNMADSRKVDTPLAAGIDPYQQSSSNMAYPYRQAIGALLYLSCKTRPDIAFCVSLLARFADKTTDIHVKMLKRVWRYLSGTRHYGIILGGDNLKCVAYSDADLAGEKENNRTTTGHIVLYGGPIIWKTKLQKCVIDNTAEAEFISVSVCSKDVRFVLNVLENLEILIDKPVINCDNQAAVKQLLAENISLKLRHINIKFLMVRDLIQRGLMSIQWISSDAQLADVLTKPLSRKNLISFVENLPLYDFVKTGEC
ncbi:hypothetical protein DERF_005358 [Dermatophagoides farinae]|uniref:Integrase catalytic domain-containing protein n=1 Tax=Dermatophagoides farinae TaxID=6954 RepID=A0A922L638_DERFA|nr:hypothetical protein DERF_005358 [Dermatophagoides farinae]